MPGRTRGSGSWQQPWRDYEGGLHHAAARAKVCELKSGLGRIGGKQDLQGCRSQRLYCQFNKAQRRSVDRPAPAAFGLHEAPG